MQFAHKFMYTPIRQKKSLIKKLSPSNTNFLMNFWAHSTAEEEHAVIDFAKIDFKMD